MGIYSAKKNGKMLDHATRFFSIGAVSLPTFWVAMVFQLVFYRILSWLPLGGRMSINASLLYEIPNVTGMLIIDCILTGSWELLGDAFVHIIMPGFTIALYPIGLVARMTRSALLEILNEDYITASKSYGRRDPHHRISELSRPWCAGAFAGMGIDDQHFAQLFPGHLVV